MVAIVYFRQPEAKHYEDYVAEDPRIDELRNKIVCVEDKQFSQDYLLPVSAQLQMEFRLTCRRCKITRSNSRISPGSQKQTERRNSYFNKKI